MLLRCFATCIVLVCLFEVYKAAVDPRIAEKPTAFEMHNALPGRRVTSTEMWLLVLKQLLYDALTNNHKFAGCT